ncbi:major facilitator superfamily domain-containing protein [Boeremia exigua]|uniref:major facilitator superfamily domain-containing protein n=1 Tax=Boeremia exigua TaxID=749465 RepID=UPI001E8CA53F|nr:major facilitator superfamily domain-containing protein [Boeremia exigua]KAH6632913.1 major facilitator superfamily domain-containing protein [Boeremia exigua]
MSSYKTSIASIPESDRPTPPEINQIPPTDKPDEKANPGSTSAWTSNEAPDGGMVAWMVVFGAWCTSFCSFGWINSIGTFQQYYSTELLPQYSPGTISWIPSLQVFFMFAMGPVVGRLYDRYGPRYLIIAGTFLHVFGLMMASISTEYYQIMLSQGVCSAIGVSLIFQPALNAIVTWFDKKRGIAYGILSTGSSIGGIVFPIMTSRLIPSLGYGWTMRVSAFLILALLILAMLTVKSRFPPNMQRITKEQLAAPFHEPEFLALNTGLCLFTFGMFIPINYLAVEAAANGMSPDLARYLVAIFNAASLFGRLLTGVLADRIGKYNVFTLAASATGISTLALWLPIGRDNDAARIAYAVLYGFFSGAYVSLIAGLVAQISPMKEIGFRTGLVFFVNSIGALTTSPIAGAILDQENGIWTGVKVFSGVFCIAGTVFVFAARVYKVGWKFNVFF